MKVGIHLGMLERHIPARKQQALSAAKVKTLKTPGMYAAGKGLNLKMEDTGAKRWIQRLIIGGKRRNIGLGRLSLGVAG